MSLALNMQTTNNKWQRNSKKMTE